MDNTSRNKDKERHWILQWNCRGIQTKLEEIKFRIQKWQNNKPCAILLQEANFKGLRIPGYHTFLSPSIIREHGKRKATAQVPVVHTREPQGLAAVLVHEDVPRVQVDTSSLCNCAREVVLVRIKTGTIETCLVSVYIRPNDKNGNKANWITDLITAGGRYTSLRWLIGGDFNAWHEDTGYTKTSDRGEALFCTMSKERLQLVNEIGRFTRLGQGQMQNDTTPDLTWKSANLKVDWRVGEDPWGSDHLPIFIKLDTTKRFKREATFTHWDLYRQEWKTLDG